MVSNFDNYIKNRKSKSNKDRIKKLIDIGLDIKKEDREIDKKNLTVRDRVLNSLLWSDNNKSDYVYQKMRNCKKFNQKYLKNNRSFNRYVNEVFDEDKKEYRKSDIFKDKKNYISKYINSKEICNSLQ